MLMGFEKTFQCGKNVGGVRYSGTLCLHAFSDLSHVPPPVFVYLLKECYSCGTRKATQKFKVLQQHVSQALRNSPKPCPSTFAVQCLYIFPLLGPVYAEGFSHLLLSSLKHLKKSAPTVSSDAKRSACRLFLDILSNIFTHEERILIKVLEIFDIKLKDIAEAVSDAELHEDDALSRAKETLECYISEFLESQSYMTAVTLLEHFSIHPSCESLLERMVKNHEYKAAEKWAEYMGRPSICLLIQKYLDMNMLKHAYEMIKKNNLKQDFPDVYHLYKESSLKKLAEKGCWDIAEMRTDKNKQLLEYLVYLALEAGYIEKVDELCQRYSLQGFSMAQAPDATISGSRYLDLKKFLLDEIIWIDDIIGLLAATEFIEGCKFIGVDCEWKPNYEKGSNPNKVSIMQIASESRVYIFDLIKLYEVGAEEMNSCFRRILSSPYILKLGYNLQCDLHQLAHSYGDLECFRYYEMLLDIQKLFNERSGGLSGLAEKILGAGLNKTRRNSNWEQRPLSQNQIEYAALDAVVLLHIFCHVREQPNVANSQDERSRAGWKSHIVSHVGDANCKSAY